MILFHNPRCMKSREALNILNEKGFEPKTRLYLKDIPTHAEIEDLLSLLNISAEGLVRKSEPDYKEKYKDKQLTEEEWINAMVDNPKLIERPIFIHNNKAIIGRPPVKVLELL